MSQISQLFNYMNGIKNGCNDEDICWRLIGAKRDLMNQPCRRLYAENKKNDVALFYVQGSFYATNATCPHSGGPLDKIAIDDIEELQNYQAVCPWHLISFDIVNGKSTSGYKVETYEVKENDEIIYIKHPEELSTIKPQN